MGFELRDLVADRRLRNEQGFGSPGDIAQTGHQWVGTIVYNGKEVLLPMVEPLLLEVNLRNKYLRMNLPEGILDL